VGMEELSQEECLRLLADGELGRVGLTMHDVPMVVPVNYALLDGDVLIRTEGGTKLEAALANAVVAFEIDGFDAVDHTGWSVLVQGIAKEVVEPEELDRAKSVVLEPWAPGPRERFVRIATYLVSGRRIGARGVARRAGAIPVQGRDFGP
jgi:nitroimidazol reductase NimA-like FMN-containing flavoprotein (pyridoxamine 5'-phosphate oxidase superfamily)